MTATNKYLWNYEVTKNSNNQTINTTTPTIIGVYGKDGAAGKGITSIAEYYARNNDGNNAPADSDFSTAVVSPDATHKYLWNYEVISYTTGSPTTTSKHIIGVYGDKGDKGDKGDNITVKSSATTYVSSTSGTTIPSSGWQNTVPSVAQGSYL